MNLSDAQQYVEKHYRHNFIFNMLDGASFWLGYSFLAPGLILPLYASHFTQDNFLIGMIPSLGTVCYLFPQLFTSNWVQRLPRKKVLPVNLGFFTERVPVILLPISVFVLAEKSPSAALIALYILYTWHSFGAGVVSVAWQDMIAKVIPTERRGRFLGTTNFLGNATGVLGAAGAAWMLANFAFPAGYGWAFAAAAFFILCSWVFIAQTREPAVLTTTETHSQLEFMRKLPAVVRADKNFRTYLLTQVVVTLGGLAGGFLMIYTVRQWNLPDSMAGNFTSAVLVGQALANLVYGPLADRRGHKLVLEISVLLGVLSVGLAAVAPSPLLFYLVFAMRGASMAGGMLSSVTFVLEFTSPEMRPTYIGLTNTVAGSAGIIAPLAGGWLANWIGFQGLFVIGFAISLAGLGLMRWAVLEPRSSGLPVQEGKGLSD